eukprot:1596534-Alexandrium_andersonii.AAC.1
MTVNVVLPPAAWSLVWSIPEPRPSLPPTALPVRPSRSHGRPPPSLTGPALARTTSPGLVGVRRRAAVGYEGA